MAYPVYYVEAGDTLPHLFDSFDGGTGASITMSGFTALDINVFKDGSTTERTSDAGYVLLDTDGTDFDMITGIHGFSLDLSDDTDAGFYAVGSWYHVVIDSVTIDAQTVSFVACAFRIVSATRGLAGTALPDAAADAAGGLVISDTGGLDIDATDTAAVRLTAARATAIDDWINGGRLDLILDTLALEATVAALNNLSAANVNAEVVDVMSTDTHAEPAQGTPGATLSISAKLDWLYKAWRNRTTSTATAYNLYNDDAVTIDTKATLADDGTTASRTEMTSGP